MNLPIPRGSFSTPMIQLRTMVSLSAEFQEQTGTSTSTDALTRIKLTRSGEDKIPRPFACILLGDGHNYQQISGGDANFLLPDGNIGLYMTKDTDPLHRFDLDLATVDAANFFGTVMDQVVALSAKDNAQADISHLPITGSTLAFFGDSEEESEYSVGNFFTCVYLITWGIGL